LSSAIVGLNYKFVRRYYFEEIGGTGSGRTDRRTGATLNAAPRQGRILKQRSSERPAT